MHSINVVRPNRRLQTCGDFHHYYSLEEPQMAASARAICASSYQIWSIRTQCAPHPNRRDAALAALLRVRLACWPSRRLRKVIAFHSIGQRLVRADHGARSGTSQRTGDAAQGATD